MSKTAYLARALANRKTGEPASPAWETTNECGGFGSGWFYNTALLHELQHDLPKEERTVERLTRFLAANAWGEPGSPLSIQDVLDAPEEHPEHWKRIRRADLGFPLLLYRKKSGAEHLADGNHRLAKAVLLKMKTVTVQVAPPDVMKRARTEHDPEWQH